MSNITELHYDLLHLLLPNTGITYRAVLHRKWPWAHCEGCRWLEPAVIYCAVCLIGLSVVHPTWVTQLVVSQSLNSDLLLCLLSATLHVMLMIDSPTTTFSKKQKTFQWVSHCSSQKFNVLSCRAVFLQSAQIEGKLWLLRRWHLQLVLSGPWT